MPRDILKEVIDEGTTREVYFVVTDEKDAGLPAASLTTLTLTLYSLHGPLAIINSRDGQNILNANNVTIDSSGNGAWQSQPLDNQILDATLPLERHRALIQWTWAGGAKVGKHEIDFAVRNLNRVP